MAGVAAMALVGDDQIEGVDGDIELVGIFVAGFQFAERSGGGLAAEEIHCQALNGANVDEGVAGLRIGQIALRENGGIELRRRRNLRV